MYNPNDEGPISPMKKLKILSEKQNFQTTNLHLKKPTLDPIKEKFSHVSHETDDALSKNNQEPLLQESSGQYVIFPIYNRDMWEKYKHIVGVFWSPVENLEEFDKLCFNSDDRQFLKFFSSFFASTNSIGLVINTFAEDFAQIIQVTEARFFYGHQLFVQDFHFEMFNKILDKIASTAEEKEKLIKIVEGNDAVIVKRNWINHWKKADFGLKMVASACIHGIFFISLDIVHALIKSKLRVSSSHELIVVIEKMIADQELFRDFACLMLGHIKSKPSRESILEMINSSVKIEFDFIINGLKMDLIDIDNDELIQIIDRKTISLKNQIFGSFEEQKVTGVATSEAAHENTASLSMQKENHKKIVFDEDF